MSNKENTPTQTHKQWHPLIIPASICKAVENGKLSYAEAYVYSIIESLNGTRGCWATNSYLAKKCGAGERSITRYVAMLIDKGLVDSYPNENEVAGRILRTYYREKNRRKKKR